MMVWSSPAFDPAGNWMAFGSLDQNIYLLDPSTGLALSAPYNAQGEVKSSPAIDDHDNLYVGTSNGDLISLKVSQEVGSSQYVMKKNWVYSIGEEIYSSPAVKNDLIVFGGIDGSVYALNQLGQLVWKFSTYSRISSSPLITADDVVIFGAKNGKLYTLDLKTGERIWSYRTTLFTQKSNLDSSPSIDVDRTIHVGSYSGIFYSIPYEYCFQHQEDHNCQFGGRSDPPNLGQKPGDTFATLRRVPNLSVEESVESDGQDNSTVAAGETIQLELVAFRNGEYMNEAAINASPSRLHVELDPPVEVKTEVSSDGKYLNIRPVTFFAAATNYHLKVRGKYFVHTKSWLGDRFQYFGLKRFGADLRFTTENSAASVLDHFQEDSTLSWSMHSMYMAQPEALDTYIPAALEGQGFLGAAFAFRPEQKRFLMLVLPGYPQEDGSVKLMPEPSKVVTMSGTYLNQTLKASGEFTLAAMGGQIPFKPFEISMQLSENGQFSRGQVNSVSSCLGMKGSGSSYSFPASLINRVCDPYLNVIGLGTFLAQPSSPQKVVEWIPEVSGSVAGSFPVRLRVLPGADRSQKHLLTWIQYNSDSLSIVARDTQVVDLEKLAIDQDWTTVFNVKAPNSLACWNNAAYSTVLFLDDQLLLAGGARSKAARTQ
jgi:hypothetical protein